MLPIPMRARVVFSPNAFLQITPSGEVIFQLPKSEMGQGIQTSLTTLLAEELDYEPADIIIEYAGVHKDFAAAGGSQLTGGSASIAVSWNPLREAGAAARAMLIAAAAGRWGVGVESCSTEPGVVLNSISGEKLGYGALAEEAKDFQHTAFELKEKSAYRWLGKSTPRLDRVAKSTGEARYGMDVQLPGMKTSVVIRPRQFGATLGSFNADTALKANGVEAIFAIHSGVAVVADTYWRARKAARLVDITWLDGPLANLDSEAILALQKTALKNESGHIAMERGDVALQQTRGRTSGEYLQRTLYASQPNGTTKCNGNSEWR